MAHHDKQDELIPRQTILLVDAAPDHLALMNDLLRTRYRIKIANSGERALRMALAAPAPDLILLDIVMPEMDGYEVCRRLKANPATRDIPVIFLSEKNEVDAERRGLELGAVDYLAKPISPPLALARVRGNLRLKDSGDFLRKQNQALEREVAARTREVSAIQDVAILAMASMAETRDSETGNHIRRTQYYVKLLAEKLKDHPRFATTLNEQYIDLLFKSAPLHDIGKVGIPDRILLKPGRFEPHEFEIMKTHTTLGRDAIGHAERALGVSLPFLALAKEIAYSHHEKWDGSGYPQGLAGEAIPLSARLLAVADVYDALISRRAYKAGMPHAQAVQFIIDGKGRHFDPEMVDAFLELTNKFQTVAARFQDSDADMASKQARSNT